MRVRKRFAAALSVLVCMAVLSGCSVRPASTSQLSAYPKRAGLGGAAVVSSSSNELSSTVVFMDDEYGFSYAVSSYVREQTIDGSALLGRKAETETDFQKQYLAYIREQERDKISGIESSYGVSIEYASSPNLDHMAIVRGTDSDGVADACTELAKIILLYDNRGYFQNSRIYGYTDEQFDRIGSVKISEPAVWTAD